MTEIRNIEGRVIGHTNGHTLFKKVKMSKHFMRVLNGWGCDVKILKDGGFEEIKILDTENDTCYVSRRQDWLDYGVKKNFGYGVQIILPLRWHEVRHRKQLSLV